VTIGLGLTEKGEGMGAPSYVNHPEESGSGLSLLDKKKKLSPPSFNGKKREWTKRLNLMSLK